MTDPKICSHFLENDRSTNHSIGKITPSTSVRKPDWSKIPSSEVRGESSGGQASSQLKILVPGTLLRQSDPKKPVKNLGRRYHTSTSTVVILIILIAQGKIKKTFFFFKFALSHN